MCVISLNSMISVFVMKLWLNVVTILHAVMLEAFQKKEDNISEMIYSVTIWSWCLDEQCVIFFVQSTSLFFIFMIIRRIINVNIVVSQSTILQRYKFHIFLYNTINVFWLPKIECYNRIHYSMTIYQPYKCSPYSLYEASVKDLSGNGSFFGHYFICSQSISTVQFYETAILNCIRFHV